MSPFLFVFTIATADCHQQCASTVTQDCQSRIERCATDEAMCFDLLKMCVQREGGDEAAFPSCVAKCRIEKEQTTAREFEALLKRRWRLVYEFSDALVLLDARRVERTGDEVRVWVRRTGFFPRQPWAMKLRCRQQVVLEDGNWRSPSRSPEQAIIEAACGFQSETEQLEAWTKRWPGIDPEKDLSVPLSDAQAEREGAAMAQLLGSDWRFEQCTLVERNAACRPLSMSSMSPSAVCSVADLRLNDRTNFEVRCEQKTCLDSSGRREHHLVREIPPTFSRAALIERCARTSESKEARARWMADSAQWNREQDAAVANWFRWATVMGGGYVQYATPYRLQTFTIGQGGIARGLIGAQWFQNHPTNEREFRATLGLVADAWIDGGYLFGQGSLGGPYVAAGAGARVFVMDFGAGVLLEHPAIDPQRRTTWVAARLSYLLDQSLEVDLRLGSEGALRAGLLITYFGLGFSVSLGVEYAANDGVHVLMGLGGGGLVRKK